jgi:hypothetical protein
LAFEQYLDADTDADRAAGKQLMKQYVDKLDGKITEWDAAGKFTSKGSKIKMKGLLSSSRRLVTAIDDGVDAFRLVRGAQILLSATPLTLVADLAINWAVETLLEQWRRKKACYQAVLMMPLKYQGREYTAGINGHMGMVVGDKKQSKMDNFLTGAGFDGKNDGDIFDWYASAMNWLSGDDREYIYKTDDQ